MSKSNATGADEVSTAGETENPHLYVGRELTTQSGIRAVSVWHLFQEQKFEIDFEYPDDALYDTIYPHTLSSIDEQHTHEGIDASYWSPPFEAYIKLWDLHGPAAWPLEALTCYLMLQGVPYARMKADAIFTQARARYLDYRHSARIHRRAAAAKDQTA